MSYRKGIIMIMILFAGIVLTGCEEAQNDMEQAGETVSEGTRDAAQDVEREVEQMQQ
ncbi:MAG: hypothetical protein ACLFPX_03525 [Candidatus Omnitrophota bacterium]